MPTDSKSTTLSDLNFLTIVSLFALGAVFLLVGWLLSLLLVPQPAVGIIRLDTDIWSGSAEYLMWQMEEAREDPRIKAVVLKLDSPGGTVSASQTLYLELLGLQQEMPVVTSINGIAASGGYYIAMATDPIYANPSSDVGNVGVWGFIPPELGVNDVVLASGPFKLTASNRSEFLRLIEGIKQEFLASVANGRGDRLRISLEDLSQGLAYPGREALRLGLIDHLGGQMDAVEAAAELAGLANYEVVDLEERVFEQRYEGDSSLLETWIGAADPLTGQRTFPAGIYLLYNVQLGGAP
ncbi:MAG: S49 family peptidase [Anaerolineae bacterium]|nr:S49 family peptidase [Anaerolineae bacterium]MDK1081342.1 S49 family peptidase [Anaerolineae bacterium]